MAGARRRAPTRTVTCPRCAGKGVVEVVMDDTVGQRVRALREAARIPRAVLAARAGITEDRLGDIECSPHCTRVGFDLACALADALGVSVSALRRRRGKQEAACA